MVGRVWGVAEKICDHRRGPRVAWDGSYKMAKNEFRLENYIGSSKVRRQSDAGSGLG